MYVKSAYVFGQHQHHWVGHDQGQMFVADQPHNHFTSITNFQVNGCGLCPRRCYRIVVKNKSGRQRRSLRWLHKEQPLNVCGHVASSRGNCGKHPWCVRVARGGAWKVRLDGLGYAVALSFTGLHAFVTRVYVES